MPDETARGADALLHLTLVEPDPARIEPVLLDRLDRADLRDATL